MNEIGSDGAEIKWRKKGEVSIASQRLYETNKRLPGLEYLTNVAKAGADFEYLLYGETASVDHEVILRKSFNLVWGLHQSNDDQLASKEDAEELFIAIYNQILIASSPTRSNGIPIEKENVDENA